MRLSLVAGTVAVVLALTAYVAVPRGDTPAPSNPIACTGPIHAERRVLVLGDSWAAGDKLHSGMLSKLGNTTRICSAGYPGAMTGEILGAVARDRGMIEQELGGDPEATIVMAGLNDAATLHGASYYSNNLQAIAQSFHGAVYVLDLPFFDRSSKRSEATRILKDVTYACVFNGCRIETFWDYRAAAAGLSVERIPYEAFLPSFRRSDYVDGIHLTSANFAALGSYIAGYISGDRRQATSANLP